MRYSLIILLLVSCEFQIPTKTVHVYDTVYLGKTSDEVVEFALNFWDSLRIEMNDSVKVLYDIYMDSVDQYFLYREDSTNKITDLLLKSKLTEFNDSLNTLTLIAKVEINSEYVKSKQYLDSLKGTKIYDNIIINGDSSFTLTVCYDSLNKQYVSGWN